MQRTWTNAVHSHAKNFGKVALTSDFNLPFGSLQFQDGPISEQGINGLTSADVLLVIIERLTALNAAPYKRIENAQAINLLIKAIAWLDRSPTERTPVNTSPNNGQI